MYAALGLKAYFTAKTIKNRLLRRFVSQGPIHLHNATLIPVAAEVLYPIGGTLLSPVFAAGAMALSSVFVLGNALRLRAFRAPIDGAQPGGLAPAANHREIVQIKEQVS